MEQISVLVVDDDHFMRDLMIRYFSAHNYDVSAASSGEEGLELIKNREFDVGIIDLMLGQMDGLELIRRIRNINKEMILIMMTGHPTLETALQVMKMGVQDYLIKPFKLDQIGETVKRCIKERDIQQENVQLKAELADLKGKLEKMNELLGHGHVSAMKGASPGIAKTGYFAGEIDHRLQGYANKKLSKEDRIIRLEKLYEEGLLEQEDYIRLKNELSKEQASE